MEIRYALGAWWFSLNPLGGKLPQIYNFGEEKYFKNIIRCYKKDQN